MKTFTMLRILIVGVLLSVSLAACSGSETMMRDDMTQEKKMDTMEKEKGNMDMPDKDMNDDMMHDKSDSM